MYRILLFSHYTLACEYLMLFTIFKIPHNHLPNLGRRQGGMFLITHK